MKKADLAMYRAKDMGRNTFQFYQPEMNASAGARLNLERRLRRALRDNEFLLHYQPQVDIVSGQIVGIEALVRWRDPEVGLVLPSAFIPVAEESGLIGPLSEWVLREACRQNKAWQDEGLPPTRVSVNLSARVFQQRDITKLVMQVLTETGLEPKYLELELTESTIMRNAEEAVSMLNELHALGIGLAIDDFGTGYSSLSYLKRFPVDRLKIDRSFVSDIGGVWRRRTITSAIIALAHSPKLYSTAEGVETSAQLDFPKERDVRRDAGFYFARPLSTDAISELLQGGVARGAGDGGDWGRPIRRPCPFTPPACIGEHRQLLRERGKRLQVRILSLADDLRQHHLREVPADRHAHVRRVEPVPVAVGSGGRRELRVRVRRGRRAIARARARSTAHAVFRPACSAVLVDDLHALLARGEREPREAGGAQCVVRACGE